MKKPTKQQSAPQGLVGRFFHIFGDEGDVRYQGKVIAQVDPTRYLVQFYDFIMGEPSTLHVFDIDAITAANILNHREPGAWQFYEDDEHWRFWYQHRAPTRPQFNPPETKQ
jgi:hypothetical protein